MERLYLSNHSPIKFHFSQNPRDFMVREIPLYEFSGSGEHQILNIRKKGLTTFEMIKILSGRFGCKGSEFGYAGLKDKSATTTQFLSINKKFTKNLDSMLSSLEEDGIKILSSTHHNNKIKIGHLKGNSFFIRIKKLMPSDSKKIESTLREIEKNGLPNYFGYQRFGRDRDNHQQGKEIVEGRLKIRDKKISKFLISAYQSYLFNEWLKRRIEIGKMVDSLKDDEAKIALERIFGYPLSSQNIARLKNQSHPFKILDGDVFSHYPFGKIFFENSDLAIERFQNRDIVPTGIISGEKKLLAMDMAKSIEERFLDSAIRESGSRRMAIVFLENLEYKYVEEKAQGEFNFSLPKGSYATIMLEEIAHRNIDID